MNTREASDTLVVLTTLPDPAQARELVRRLVNDRLVACGNVLPSVTSIYRWEGEVQEEAEVLVVLKTSAACWERLSAAVRASHPYDVPELIALPVRAGHEAYLAWIARETGQEDAA